MATRVIYQSLALYASQTLPVTGNQTGNGSISEVTRVTEFSDSFQRNLENVLVFGNLAPIDRLDVEPPTVNGNFTYYPTNGYNESGIGFTVTTGNQPLVSCISGILNKTTDEKNYYLLVVEQGNDAAGYNGTYSGVIGIGNAYISDYTLNISVGSLVTTSVGYEGLNWVAYADIDGTNTVPAIDPINGTLGSGLFVLPQFQTNQVVGQVSALQYGQATLAITGDFGFGPTQNNYNIQTATLSIPLSREPINRLGSKYPFSREITFPVIANLQVEAEITGISNKNLANILCEGPQNLGIRIDKPYCPGAQPVAGMIYVLRGAKITNLDQTNSVGPNATVSVTYELAIGGPQDTGVGIFMSGSF